MNIDIYQLLKQEHQTVNELIRRLESASGDRSEILRELELELISHSYAEIETIYTALSKSSDGKQLIADFEEEHLVVESLLGECQESIDDDEMFLSKLEMLKDNVQRHVQKEESELFRIARETLDDVQAEALASEFLATKMDARDRAASAGGRAGREEIPAPTVP